MPLLKTFVAIALLGVCWGEDLVSFYLTTEPQNVRVGLNHNEDKMNLEWPFKFIIHGWTQNANLTPYIDMADAFLSSGDYNVIRVDYSKVAILDYVRAASGIRDVGGFIGDFISKLHLKRNVSLSNVHLIGHSMGAQVAGYTARSVFAKTGSKIGRITGNDAARPGFENGIVPESRKLTSKDAEMVDIVHTDAAGYGYKDPVGTVDFYPNGGRRLQPNCIPNPNTGFDFIPSADGFSANFVSPSDNFCSHHLSNDLFTESIFTKTEATKCDSWQNYIDGKCDSNEKILFGYQTPKEARGAYFFSTRKEAPYLRTNSEM